MCWEINRVHHAVLCFAVISMVCSFCFFPSCMRERDRERFMYLVILVQGPFYLASPCLPHTQERVGCEKKKERKRYAIGSTSWFTETLYNSIWSGVQQFCLWWKQYSSERNCYSLFCRGHQLQAGRLKILKVYLVSPSKQEDMPSLTC